MEIQRKVKAIILLIFCMLFFVQCTTNSWTYQKTIDLKDAKPIGLVSFQDKIWVSDGENNQILVLDAKGKLIEKLEEFERPMHLSSNKQGILIPEYSSDKVSLVIGKNKQTLEIKDSLDAPAGVHSYKNELAIVDFYRHRVLFFDGGNWLTVGRKGHNQGEFYYPTDVHITERFIYVADAYNHRIQKWNKKGKLIRSIGEEEKINTAAGIFVEKEKLYVTDFENNRVLIYSTKGELEQIISDNLEKPTDLEVIGKKLYITNYESGDIVVYE